MTDSQQEWMIAHMSIRPQPKPTRDSRQRVKIETADLALPKRHFVRDGDYRAWIRQHRCILANFEKRCARIGDRPEIEAAHLEHGGRGIKGSDATCIPLCPVHHDRLDAETLPWQIVAFLWKRALFFREEHHRRTE